MKRAHRISCRAALLLVAGTAVVSAAPPLSALGAIQAPRPRVEGNERQVPDVVRRLIVEQSGVAEQKVSWDARFVEDLGFDSLDSVELTMAVEEAFKIDIPDEAAEKLRRVGDLVEYLRSRKVAV